MAKLLWVLSICGCIFSTVVDASSSTTSTTSTTTSTIRDHEKLICIFDRHVHGKIVAGNLYATMGMFEACTVTFAKAIFQQLPVLVSKHVVKNLCDMVSFKSDTGRRATIGKLLEQIPQKLKDNVIKDTEIDFAVRFNNEKYQPSQGQLDDFKERKGSDSTTSYYREYLRKNSYIYTTKNPNLQLFLILPRVKGERKNASAALREHGYSEKAFEVVSFDEGVDSYFSKLYTTESELAAISSPLDMNAFSELFVIQKDLRRSILLLGHGNVGIIAQLNIKLFQKLVEVFDAIGCACLSVFSCHAGAEQNSAVYKVAKNFPIIVFSVGDMVSSIHVSFSSYDKNFVDFGSYFKGIDQYLSYGVLKDSKALNCLFDAVAKMHVGIVQNYPWFWFPGESALIHLSELMKIEQDKKTAESTAGEKKVEGEAKVSDASDVSMENKLPTPASSTSPDTTIIDEKNGMITTELNNIAMSNKAPLIFDGKKSLLLKESHITATVKILKSIPFMVPMAQSPLYCFEDIDIGSLYLNTLLKQLVLVQASIVIKKLSCVNYRDSNIADNVCGKQLLMRNLLVLKVLEIIRQWNTNFIIGH